MAKIAESVVEESTLAWFEELGWSVLHGPDITPGEPAAERESYSDVILRDLLVLEEVKVRYQGKRYLLRTLLKGVCRKVLQGAVVAIPLSVWKVKERCGAKTSSQAL
jgi:type I restriction enzyme R subunit